MRVYVVLALVLWVLGSCDLSSSDGGRDCLNGEGPVISEIRSLGGEFRSIVHQIPGSIFITQGSPASLTVEGQENLLAFLSSEVDNEILTLNFERCLNSGQPFNVFVEIPDLRAVSLAGLGNITLENDVTSERLEASIVGAGNINLRGFSDTLEIVIVGQGNAFAFDMESDLCEVDITGQGNVEVTVNDVLDVVINGQGNVFFQGMPSITSEINGSGEIVDAN